MIAAVCFLAFWGGTVSALADDGATVKMPVLRVNFEGKVARDMPYVDGTMQLTDAEGNQIEMKAKFKTRGATAQQYLMKPSLNMKLRTDDYSASQDSTLLGIRSASKWILDAMAVDRICMRNRVCMDLWNEFSPLPYETEFDGRSGTVGKFVEVYINGEYKGIYCLSDHINRKLLDLKKFDEKKGLVRGVLYKSGTEDIADQNKRNFSADWTAATIDYHNAWELKEPEDHECKEAWDPLIDLYDNHSKTFDDVKKYFFLENLADFQLHVMAFAIQDNWGNKNHFFSIRNIQKDIDDPDPNEAARRKCVVSPWDLDASLGGAYNGSYYDGTYSNWALSDVVKNGGFYPFSICQGQAEYKALLKSRWEVARAGAFSKENVNRHLEAYRDLFINSGAWQRMVDHFEGQSSKPLYVKDLAKEISLVEKWYSDRFDLMDKYFDIDTGISTTTATQATPADNAIYSIEGVRLSEAPQKGLYIQGGKLRMK